jgi:hypothetical protein
MADWLRRGKRLFEEDEQRRRSEVLPIVKTGFGREYVKAGAVGLIV